MKRYLALLVFLFSSLAPANNIASEQKVQLEVPPEKSLVETARGFAWRTVQGAGLTSLGVFVWFHVAGEFSTPLRPIPTSTWCIGWNGRCGGRVALLLSRDSYKLRLNIIETSTLMWTAVGAALGAVSYLFF